MAKTDDVDGFNKALDDYTENFTGKDLEKASTVVLQIVTSMTPGPRESLETVINVAASLAAAMGADSARIADYMKRVIDSKNGQLDALDAMDASQQKAGGSN